MRLFTVLITCSMLIACGKTGALYLPEEPQESQESQEPAEQNAQPQNQDASSGEKAD
jgi:predicted small lipoprotein YifL